MLADPASRRGIPLIRAQALKREAQAAAHSAYKARNLGTQGPLSADDLMDEAVAKGLQKAIEHRVGRVAPVNRRTQSRIGVDRMVSDAMGREGNTLGLGGMRDLIAVGAGGGLGATVGAPVEGATVGFLLRLLSAPGTGSRTAILMNDAARLGMPPQLLRLLTVRGQDQP